MLPAIRAGLIAFAVLAYVLLDGFDLGVAASASSSASAPRRSGAASGGTAPSAPARRSRRSARGWCRGVGAFS